jgi:eukaryotic-like serine/threonine-protein kinase
MTTDRQTKWREISPYLDEALELTDEAREAWLRDLDERAPGIASAVRALLADQAQLADSPLLTEDPIAGLMRASLAGTRLGSYTLISVLGHGGMGTVWLAERSDGRFEGRAAVKLLSAALVGQPAEQRFIQEGSVLAKLQHPNIAQLIDAGVAPGGQPYLVLEYVEGERIDAYAERHALDVKARVRLFLDVLAAVAHAHSHLIVHRDLKPSNIFVTDSGIVKLLDFGVAALLGPDRSELTREGRAAMTPEYAAPEQLLGTPVTTATDVYALGLVLFVLLVGRHPLAREGQSAPELALSTLQQEPPHASAMATDVQRERALRGDLDNIVSKALKKEPQDRYSSAELLEQDLRRYLANEPVSARPDTFAYRAAKFTRRHRGGVVSAALTALAIIAAIVVTTAEMFEARRQRDAAVFQSKRAEYQARFAYQIMSEVGSDERPITIRELMHKGIDVLEKNYGDDPRFVISALINISGRYMDLGDTAGEYAALLKAEKVARKIDDPSEIAAVQCNTVETELQAGRPKLAAERMRDGLANLAKIADPPQDIQLDCHMAQARLLWGQGDTVQAIPVARDVATRMEANHQEGDVRYGTITSMLVIMLADSGYTREALKWNQLELTSYEQSGRADTMSMNGIKHNQASLLSDGGNALGAYDLEKKNVEAIVANQGADAVPPPFSHRLGFYQVRVQETDAGLVWIERAKRQAAAQTNRPAQIGALIGEARAELILGRSERVVPDLEEAERLIADSAGDYSAALQNDHLVRAKLLVAQGDAAAAIPAISALLTELEYPAKRNGRALSGALVLRSRAESMLGRYSEALQTAREALVVSEEHALNPDQSADVGAALMSLAVAQLALGDAAGARGSARRAAATLSKSLGATHSETRAAEAFATKAALASG